MRYLKDIDFQDIRDVYSGPEGLIISRSSEHRQHYYASARHSSLTSCFNLHKHWSPSIERARVTARAPSRASPRFRQPPARRIASMA